MSKKNEKQSILNICFNHTQFWMQEIEEVVTSLIKELTKTNFKIMLIAPDFTGYNDAKLSKNLEKAEIYEILHDYNGRQIKSQVIKTEEQKIIKYLVKPLPLQLSKIEETELFSSNNDATEEKFRDLKKLIPKIAYFNSVVAAFIMLKDLSPKLDLIYAHGWECGLVARILKENYIQELPKCLLGLYTQFEEQEMIINLENSIINNLKSSMSKVKLFPDLKGNVLLLREAMLGADHVVYGSSWLTKQVLTYINIEGFRFLCQRYNKQEKTTLIMNGICDTFDPVKLSSISPKLSLFNLVKSKFQAKIILNDLINSINNDKQLQVDYLLAKKIDPNKPMVIFIANTINLNELIAVEAAIEATINQDSNFLIFTNNYQLKDYNLINQLIKRYKEHPKIIILGKPEGSNDILINKYQGLIRFAADLSFIPTYQGSCNLICMEAQLNANLVITSEYGVLKDRVKERINGFIYQFNEVVELQVKNIQFTVSRAISFLIGLSKNFSKHQEKLNSLYDYSYRYYLWNGAEGSIKQYIKLFKKLLPQLPEKFDYLKQGINFLPEKIIANLNQDPDLSSGSIIEVDKLQTTKMDIFLEISKNTHYLMRTPEGDLIAVMTFKDPKGNKQLIELENSGSERILLGKLLYSYKSQDLIGGFMAIKEYKITDLKKNQALFNEFNILYIYNELFLTYLGENDKFPEFKYVFQKLYSGSSLEKTLIEKKFSLIEKFLISFNILNELNKLHKKNIIHPGINIKNIIITDQEFISFKEQKTFKIKLTDFKASRFLNSSKTYVELDHWTQSPPVEVQKFNAGFKTDVYAIGVVLCKLFAEEFSLTQAKKNNLPTIMQFINAADPLFHPLAEIYYDQKATQFLNSKISDSYHGRSRLSLQQLQELIAKMLSVNYEERPNVIECINNLKRILDNLIDPEPNERLFTMELYEFCLKFGFDITDLSKPNIYNANALNYACEYGWIEIATQILSIPGFKQVVSDPGGNSALHYAVRHGNRNLIKLLLENGADPNLLNAEGLNSLNLLEQQQLHSKNKQQIKNLFILHQFIVNYGFCFVDLNLPNNNGDLPLTLLIQHQLEINKTIEIGVALLENGAYVNAKDLQGKNALYYALKYQSNNLLDFLINYGADPQSLLMEELEAVNASKYKDLLMIYAFCKQHKLPGLGMKVYNDNGLTALGISVINNDFISLELFINSYKTNNPEITIKEILSIQDLHGDTPLHVAVKNNNASMVRTLLEKGANVYLENFDSQTVMDLIQENHEIKLLLKNELEKNIEDLSSFANENIFLITAYDHKAFNKIFSLITLKPDLLSSSHEFLNYIINHKPKILDIIEVFKMGFDIDMVFKEINISTVSIEIKEILHLIKFFKHYEFKLSLEAINEANHNKYTPLTKAIILYEEKNA